MTDQIPPKQLRPADELRHLLTESEKLAVNIKGAGGERALELLHWLDRIDDLFVELDTLGVDVKAEAGRWVGVQGAVERYSGAIRRELKPLGGLAHVRAGLPEPPPEHRWWWRLDILHREQQQRRLRRLVIGAVAVAVLLVAAYWLFNKLFPVDPVVQETYKLQLQAEQALEDGDLETAVAQYEAILDLAPDNDDALAMLVALHQLSGQQTEADRYLERLTAAQPHDVAQIALIRAYLLTNQSQAALDLAEEALRRDPEAIGVYLLAASAYEQLGDYNNTIAMLQKASDLADEQGDAELQAIARIRLGQLLQSKALLPTPAPPE